MKVFYNNKYVASKYAFDTTRKSKEIADSLQKHPIEGVELVDPTAFEDTALALISDIHSTEYVEDVRTGGPLADSQGFDWDPGIYTMALAHSSGLVAAIEEVSAVGGCAGSLSSGLHHSRHDGGAGFCTFNGLAVAAMHATNLGYTNICVIDFDAHGGGGTYSLIQKFMPSTVSQVDVVVSAFDVYSPADPKHHLEVVRNNRPYGEAIMEAMKHAVQLAPDLVIYNAGMDPINAGYLRSELAYREELVTDILSATKIPSVFAMAGGYTWGSTTMGELVNLHRLTVRAFAEHAHAWD